MAIQAQHQYSDNLGLGFCGSSAQEWMENNGGGLNEQELYLSLLQQQQLQQQQQMMMQNQQLVKTNALNQNLGVFGFDCSNGHQVVSSSTTCSNNHLQSMDWSQSVLIQVEKQKQEINRFIAVQNERLRLALHEQRRQQLAVLLTSLESKAVNLLKQKDLQLADATKKSMELEACLRKAEMENQSWQRVAKQNEALVTALNNTLEQLRENPDCYYSGFAEDTGSCCNENENETRESKAEAATDEKSEEEEETMKKMVCKGCKSRNSCVLFLPCRHLCSCKSCEAFFSSCPVCKSVKKASIEVYLS